MDPAFDMPAISWGQQGSFKKPVAPPVDGPDGGTLIQLPCINQDWVLLLMGAVDQLRNPSTWLESLSDSARDVVLSRVTKLQEMLWSGMDVPCCAVEMRLTSDCHLQFSVDGGMTWTTATGWDANIEGCVKSNIPVKVPTQPPGQTPQQNACGIADYLSHQIKQEIIAKAAAARSAGQDVNTWIKNITADIGAFSPVLEFFIQPLQDFFVTAVPQPVSDLVDASTSATLWQDVTCAIYNAIVAVGYVDATNFAAVQTNIAAISYTHVWIPPALSLLWAHAGLAQWQQLQQDGSTNIGNCTGCSGSPPWCNMSDFTGGSPLWYQAAAGQGTLVGGAGWESQFVAAQGQNVLSIAAGPSGPRSVSAFRITISSPGPHTSGVNVRQAALYHSGVQVAHVDLPNGTFAANSVITAVFSPAVLCDQYLIVWSSDSTNVSVISRVDDIGIAPAPAGVITCV